MATKTANTTEKRFTLKEVFAMWRQKSKAGKTYFNGTDKEGNKFVGYYNTNKEQPKDPDIRIYRKNEKGDIEKHPYCVLWSNVSENNNKYLSGKIDGKRVVGFINTRATSENKVPYFSVYWSDSEEEKKPAETYSKKSTRKQKHKEEPEIEETETDLDLPF